MITTGKLSIEDKIKLLKEKCQAANTSARTSTGIDKERAQNEVHRLTSRIDELYYAKKILGSNQPDYRRLYQHKKR